jgi:hypothetical protein
MPMGWVKVLGNMRGMQERGDQYAMNLIAIATRIVTEDGHLVQRWGKIWYAYPKVDGLSTGEGGPVIVEASTGALKPFATAELAYQACLEALQGREMTHDQWRATQVSLPRLNRLSQADDRDREPKR